MIPSMTSGVTWRSLTPVSNVQACSRVGTLRVLIWVSGPLALHARGVQTRPLVLDNLRVIDGSGAPPIEHGRVVIEGDRVTRVGPAESVALPATAERLDLAGRTVVPGLIDLHFHIEN